ncbi:hypothetical protein B0A55_09529 [Friedmanniomyces simplex]|uniref:Amino acid permease/ SLC12A domain-containing protein n=1 Tax=Friedmanniomyces simplex TaxID=329884 RepID=A0A4U0X8C5_9PEZI|nr:hypothetical protein B0A55_09529 [Friedmanniomyces simplex]
MQADLVMFETYGDIDLNEDPCIFTGCGHIFTLSSMDGIMDMAKHYDIDPTIGDISGLKTSSEPFSSDELKSCPTCRGSLRSRARYGRIVRRKLLDESAKKLTAWSNRTHAELAERLASDREQLMTSIDTALKPSQDIKLDGSQLEQHRAIKKLRTNTRYRRAFATRHAIQTFADKLRKEEQLHQRVRDLVETARRQNVDSPIAEFTFSGVELQLREHLQANSLLIRCDTVIICDVVSMHNRSTAGRMESVLKIDFAANRALCDELAKAARETHSIRQEVEGQLLWAHFAAIECGTFDAADEDIPREAIVYREALNDEALDRLTRAENVCERFTGNDLDPTQGMIVEINDVRRMLNEGVSTSEMKMVVAAMAKEFRGTGHWYRCQNSHPFTVGECGDEVKDPEIRVPKSLVTSYCVNAVVAFGFMIVLLFFMGDPEKALGTATGWPIIQICYQAGRTLPAANTLKAIVIIPSIIGYFNSSASVSRLSWAFARDDGLPFSEYFEVVHPKLRIPIRALALTTTASMLLLLVPIGSAVAFNAIVSLAIVGLYFSYLMPCLFAFMQRLNGETIAPSAYSWARWGVVLYGSASVYATFVIIWICFPTTCRWSLRI